MDQQALLIELKIALELAAAAIKRHEQILMNLVDTVSRIEKAIALVEDDIDDLSKLDLSTVSYQISSLAKDQKDQKDRMWGFSLGLFLAIATSIVSMVKISFK